MAVRDKTETEDTRAGTNSGGLSPYLYPISVWALAFGCAVGWGAFVMPGTSFLPAAGPAGTAIAMLLSTAIMLVIAANYHYMMIRCPDSGGALITPFSASGLLPLSMSPLSGRTRPRWYSWAAT